MDAAGDKGKKRPHSASSGSAGKAPGSANAKPNSAKKSKPSAPKSSGTGTTPKKKVFRKRKPKKAKKEDRTRDFSGDLEDYLEQWEARANEGSTWKFNKILQAWALMHCFNKKKIANDLFKQLLPYLMTVQGGALDRLTSRAAVILSTDKSDIVDDDAEVAPTAEDAAEEEAAEPEADEDDDENATKKVEIITKSMAHRAKKIQKGLNA